jgi:outer membrane protein TolC
MKIISKIIIIGCLSSVLINSLHAQSNETPESQINKIGIVFPPIEQLIDSAIKHNSNVKYRNLDIDAKEALLKTQHNVWLRNLGIQGVANYGTFDYFNSNSNNQSTTVLNTNSKQFNYGMGVYLKLPFYDVIDRKNQLNVAKIQLEQSKSIAQVQIDELRQIVIRLYEDILLKQKLLNIKSQSWGNAKVNMEMVEKEFRNGTIPVSEFVRVSDIVSRTEAEYETAKTDFISARKILEEVVGFSFYKTNSNSKK